MPSVAADARAQSGEPIASLGWLTGCLEARSATRVVEEQRMPLRAGTMLGMHEAHPKGQPSATFVARAANADSVVFEAPEHDFPQRVAYRRVGRDSVLAWVEGTMNGTARRFEFPYRRVPCPTAPSP